MLAAYNNKFQFLASILIFQQVRKFGLLNRFFTLSEGKAILQGKDYFAIDTMFSFPEGSLKV